MHTSQISALYGKLPTLAALLAGAVLVSSCNAYNSGAGAGDSQTDTDSGTDTGTGPSSCELPAMRSWVNDNMLDYYLFSDQVPTVNLNDYADVETLIRDLRATPFDRFSYVDDAQRSNAFFEEGKFFGFGWRLERTSDSDVQFKLINPDSPITQHDVRRGDFLRAINGVNLDDITSEQIDVFLGIGDAVVSPVLTIQRGTATPFTITVTKTTFNLQTVIETNVVQEGNQRVGYLHFLSFLQTSSAELDSAFEYLATQNINELVLDLRYNGGGRIDVAGKLAAQIGGNLVQNQDFARFEYNQRYANENFTFPYPAQTKALDLSRVFVLTTGETCSASELVINGLRPFVEVITVGSTSCGKPYGTRADEACGKAMHALRISLVNAEGVGDYYEGLDADCPANDNLNDTLGTPTEALFSSALEYIRTGSCNAIAYRSKPPTTDDELLNPYKSETRGLLR